jgi:hypothetical protein
MVKDEIKKWLNGPQDYAKGLELLNRILVRNKIAAWLNKGESKARHEKLAYLLSKEIGLNHIPKPGIPKKKDKKPIVTPSNVETESADLTSKNDEEKPHLIKDTESIDDYPVEIRALINEYSELYKRRSISHKEMTELGDSNKLETVTFRIKYIEDIKALSAKMETLFAEFKSFKEKGVIEKNADLNKGKEEIPQGLAKLSIDNLKKVKKNIQASLVKDKNFLKYQEKTKPASGKANPVPEGPKKIRLEKRVETKEALIVQIDTLLAQKE